MLLDSSPGTAEAARPDALEPGLRPLLEQGLRRARQEHRPVVASLVRAVPASDPLAWLARAGATASDRLVWLRPRAGRALVGVGAAHALVVRGPARFSTAARAWRDLAEGALVAAPGTPEPPGTGPLLLGGFAFDPRRPPSGLWDGFPDGRLVLPRRLLTLADGAAWLTANAVLWPDSDLAAEGAALTVAGPAPPAPRGAPEAPNLQEALPPAAWQATVRSLRASIRAGDLQKVVLARGCRVRAAAPFDPPGILRRLAADYPSCVAFGVARGERCFLGATPERLVRLRDGVVSTMCLAGSIGRGRTGAEDRRLGDALLASAKDHAEHAVALGGLLRALGPACLDLRLSPAPALVKFRNVQHLLTRVSGRAAPGQTILDLVGRLHPTPAVGGEPRELALRLIRERERLDRGWYAGPIGWVDRAGDGEFAVAIRSALLRGSEAWLFAGCGIVADSEPAAEWAEASLKLQPVLSALGARAC